jgi:hypothetical protein
LPLGLRAGALAICTALLAGCGGDPEPAAEPESEPERPGVTAADEEPAAEEPPPAETPSVVIKLDTFPKDVMDLQVKDLVEVQMTEGRPSVRGTVRGVRPRQLSVALQGSGITTQLKPEDVAGVKLLYREDPSALTVTADAPLNEQETWLERFADREILGKNPVKLWRGRFARNVPLKVSRAFDLGQLTFVKRSGSKKYFLPDSRDAHLRPGDSVKLVGTSLGTESVPASGKDRTLGEVYLYLVRRKNTAFAVYSFDRLQAKNLDPKSVERFLENEPVTLAVSRPGSMTHLKVVRVRASVARKYSRYLEQTPDRPAVRRLRAQRDPGLAKAEKQVRAVYKAVDLTKESDLDKPVVVAVRVPTSEAGIHLLPFKKELGLD